MIEHAERAMTLADAEGDRPVQLFARFALGRAFLWKGRLQEVVRLFDQVPEIGGGDAGADVEVLGWRPYVECLSLRAVAQTFMGRPREALEFVNRLPVFLNRPGVRSDMSSVASDRCWTHWIVGDANAARRCSSESLQMAERFGDAHNIVYALLTCGVASFLALRWEEGDAFLERARTLMSTSSAGREWAALIDGYQAICRAGMGDAERSLALAQRCIEQARAGHLPLILAYLGSVRARVLRMVGGRQRQDDLEAQVRETLEGIQRHDIAGCLPFVLLERAGLARSRGDAGGMASDLTEARRLFAEMGVTGWDDYARSIEA